VPRPQPQPPPAEDDADPPADVKAKLETFFSTEGLAQEGQATASPQART